MTHSLVKSNSFLKKIQLFYWSIYFQNPASLYSLTEMLCLISGTITAAVGEFSSEDGRMAHKLITQVNKIFFGFLLKF